MIACARPVRDVHNECPSMDTSPNAVSDLIRRATSRRLGTDPADVQLFQRRELDGVRPATPRGNIDWRPPPPEPPPAPVKVAKVVRPRAPRRDVGRWRWKFSLLLMMAIAGGVPTYLQMRSGTDQVARPTASQPPPVQPQPQVQPVVAAPAPAPAPVPVPAPEAPIAALPPPVPTITSTPEETQEAPPVGRTRAKKRAHATRHAVKPAAKHATAAAATPAAVPAPQPAKPAVRGRPSAQSNDNENPL